MADELSVLRASLAEKAGAALQAPEPTFRGRRLPRAALLAVLVAGGAAATAACVRGGVRFPWDAAPVHVCPEDPLWQPL